MRRILLLAAALVLGAACQQAPVSHPPVSTLSPAEQLKTEGDAFMAKGDYVNAVEKYRQAADLDPAAVAPRFGLGTAYSFLEKRPEAVLQFRWVLGHADAASREYQEARRWLTRVGALSEPTVADAGQKDETRPVDDLGLERLLEEPHVGFTHVRRYP